MSSLEGFPKIIIIVIDKRAKSKTKTFCLGTNHIMRVGDTHHAKAAEPQLCM